MYICIISSVQSECGGGVVRLQSFMMWRHSVVSGQYDSEDRIM